MDTELRRRNRGDPAAGTLPELNKEESRSTGPSSRRWTQAVVAVAALIFLILAVVCPVTFRASLTVRKSLLFMNWLNLPLFRNLSNPESEFGLNCTRNLYISNHDDSIRIGAWHVLPRSRLAECDLQDPVRLPDARAFDDDRQVVLYLHGNGGARGGNHRRGLYQVLAYSRLLDFHVVAVDYRGYGDSSPVAPTANGLVDDASVAYDWLLAQVQGRRERITIWGHSLGTAVATYLVSRTDPEGQPSSLVLEAPFNSVADAVRNHPMALLFSLHPLFEYFFVQPVVAHADTSYETETKIRHVHCHLLILHARDDMIIPFALGQKLLQAASLTRPATAPKAQFVAFDSSKKYGHKGIFKDDQLPDLVSRFVQQSRQSSASS